jgi:hypothetical protein
MLLLPKTHLSTEPIASSTAVLRYPWLFHTILPRRKQSEPILATATNAKFHPHSCHLPPAICGDNFIISRPPSLTQLHDHHPVPSYACYTPLFFHQPATLPTLTALTEPLLVTAATAEFDSRFCPPSGETISQHANCLSCHSYVVMSQLPPLTQLHERHPLPSYGCYPSLLHATPPRRQQLLYLQSRSLLQLQAPSSTHAPACHPGRLFRNIPIASLDSAFLGLLHCFVYRRPTTLPTLTALTEPLLVSLQIPSCTHAPFPNIPTVTPGAATS